MTDHEDDTDDTPTPGPWTVKVEGKYVSVIGPRYECHEVGCTVEHRRIVAWDIRHADAVAIVEATAAFSREAACMTDLEAIGDALGWQAGEYTYPALASGVATLRAEVDRLRSLPVIPTCGDCRHIWNAGAAGAECNHERGNTGPVESKKAPPTWCPQRGAR
jgi:hypothetical protein